jgi:hypothetical protein
MMHALFLNAYFLVSFSFASFASCFCSLPPVLLHAYFTISLLVLRIYYFHCTPHSLTPLSLFLLPVLPQCTSAIVFDVHRMPEFDFKHSGLMRLI